MLQFPEYAPVGMASMPVKTAIGTRTQQYPNIVYVNESGVVWEVWEAVHCTYIHSCVFVSM